MTITRSQVLIVRAILSSQEDKYIPRKYMNPKLEKRRNVKRPYWFIRIHVPGPDGKRRRVAEALGFCDEMSQKQAMKLRSQTLEVVNAGKFLVQARIRFADLVKQYVDARLPQFGAGTQAWQRSLIDNHILPAFGGRQLADINKPSVEAWLAGKERDGLSWWTRKSLRGVLTAIYAAARDWNLWSGDSPAVGVKIGRKREVYEKRLLSAEQLRQLLAALSDDTRLMVQIQVLLGLRISEVCGLQWGDIDFRLATLTVKRRWYRGDVDQPKTEASKRPHELGPLVHEFLRRYQSLCAGVNP